MRRPLLVLSILALCGCAPDRPEKPEHNDGAATSAMPIPASTSAAAAAGSLTLIPAAYLGIFDEDAAACAAPSTQTRVAIEPAQLRFLEGNAKVQGVTLAADGSAAVDARLAIEATPGPHVYTLAPGSAGTLSITDAGATTSYTRCADPAPVAKPLLNIAGDGLAVVDAKSGASRLLPFGTPRVTVVRGTTAARGGITGQGATPLCGDGLAEVDFAGGLALYFKDDGFAGWAIARGGARDLSTANGIALGQTRAQLEDVGSPVVDGTRFTSGGLAGTFDGAGEGARINRLSAGTICPAR